MIEGGAFPSATIEKPTGMANALHTGNGSNRTQYIRGN